MKNYKRKNYPFKNLMPRPFFLVFLVILLILPSVDADVNISGMRMGNVDVLGDFDLIDISKADAETLSNIPTQIKLDLGNETGESSGGEGYQGLPVYDEKNAPSGTDAIHVLKAVQSPGVYGSTEGTIKMDSGGKFFLVRKTQKESIDLEGDVVITITIQNLADETMLNVTVKDNIPDDLVIMKGLNDMFYEISPGEDIKLSYNLKAAEKVKYNITLPALSWGYPAKEITREEDPESVYWDEISGERDESKVVFLTGETLIRLMYAMSFFSVFLLFFTMNIKIKEPVVIITSLAYFYLILEFWKSPSIYGLTTFTILSYVFRKFLKSV